MKKDASQVAPPKLATRFFEWYCNEELQESIQGDLLERFEDIANRKGIRRAKINYYLDVIRLMNKYTLRRSKKHHRNHFNPTDMLKYNFLISLRFLSKHRGYALINLIGLSIGLASCLLIFLFLKNELSFDRFHANSENIYRVTTRTNFKAGNRRHFANTPPAFAPGIRGLFPEVKKASRLRYATRTRFSKEDKSFYEDQGFYADSVFLEIFDFEMIAGDAGTALDEPNSIVMTEDMALKYFDDPEPIGETIMLNGDQALKITGILEPVPGNSHIQFDYLISFPTYVVPEGYRSDLESWDWLGFLTYIEVTPDTDINSLTQKFNNLYIELFPDDEFRHQANIQPLHDIYLGSAGIVDDLNSHLKSGNRFTIHALGIIAGLILIIAGFNFMNLSTAMSVNRGKEVGVRKVLGADKGNLIKQLLAESVLISLLSLFFAILISFFSFNYLSNLLAWDFTLPWHDVFIILPIVLIFVILFGIISGLYPSLLLTRFNPISALKGSLKLSNGSNNKLSSTLVLTQFCISIGLITATIVVTKQINLLREQSLGFNKENIIVLKLLPEDMSRYYNPFRERLLQNSQILSVSTSERLMGDPWPGNPLLVEGQDETDAKQVSGIQVGFDYLKTHNIKLKEGRDFSPEFAGVDSLQTIIINEKAVEYFGLENPIGKRVYYFSIDGSRTIIGVVEDFNFASLHNEIGPMVLIMPFINLKYAYIRITPGNIADKIQIIENEWQKLAPGVPLEYYFMDDHLNNLYQKEEKLSWLISGFSILAVLLACLGLYGLVSFMINNRLKEVGIRKVLGASLPSILFLFSRRYIILVGMALVISIPLMRYVLHGWLNNFAYRIEISWWVYVLAGLSLLLLALASISQKIIKAARVNPADILKDD